MKKLIRFLSGRCCRRSVASGVGRLLRETLIEPLPAAVLDLSPQEERNDRRSQVASLPEGEGLDSEREERRRSEERQADHAQDRVEDAELEPDPHGGKREVASSLEGELTPSLEIRSRNDSTYAEPARVSREQEEDGQDEGEERGRRTHVRSFS